METIKSYLEAMFANMPNTPEVIKAKAELLAMMEDKYNELISEGESENAAVGTVISEFGNLDELAEDLGLEKEVEETHTREAESPRRFVSASEVEDYLATRKKKALMVGIGVMLCICSVTFPIIIDEVADGTYSDLYGACGMFAAIAIAVGLFVFSGIISSDWKFLTKEPCQIDMTTANMVKERRKGFKPTHALFTAIGVMLCAFSWLPFIIIDADLIVSLLFYGIGLGVFLIIYSSKIMDSYNTVLKLNDSKTISGNYGNEGEDVYINKNAKLVMELYWSTITCLYLIISFLTFRWDITWIIWPLAGVAHKILNIAFTKEE